MNEDRASRYHRLRRRAAAASTIAGSAWLVWLLTGGSAARLAGWSLAWGGALLPRVAGRQLGVAIFMAALACGWDAVSLPFDFYRSLLDRKYGLSSEPPTAWLRDHLKALAIGLILSIGAGLTVYGTIGVAGALWWLVAAALFAAAAVGLSRMAPVLLMPLFYRFRPLDRDALRGRLVDLSRRAGVPVLGAFEWALGEKTTRANAAVVGMGRTRRILVSDTLLSNYSDDEIEVILAHEIAHHLHHDLWTGIALEALIVAAALFAANVAVVALGPRFGIAGAGDLAAVPLMVLAGGAVSVLLTPFGNAWSRRNERRADGFALTLTGRRESFVSAMRRLGAQNLAEERPSRPVFWFFHTHPTIDERIAAATRVKL
jgi:STE24 endopeptidase